MSNSADDMRVCLLTGAGGGLGTALCTEMDRRYLISAVCRSKLPRVDSQEVVFVDPLSQEPKRVPKTFVIKADFEDESQIERVIELTLARFGRIDLLINNAGQYITGPLVPGKELLEDASRMMEINALVPLRLAVTAARMFWKERRAENIKLSRNIVNVSSTAGLKLYENQGQSLYAASKAALNTLTVHMSHEFSRFGVRVNAVAPNSFPGIVPTSRVVEEILKLDAGSMSGEIVRVDADAAK
jgi:NAD(P)-dependent dehydrogenase (short-subunit alcohol dehydrogenase family)